MKKIILSVFMLFMFVVSISANVLALSESTNTLSAAPNIDSYRIKMYINLGEAVDVLGNKVSLDRLSDTAAIISVNGENHIFRLNSNKEFTSYNLDVFLALIINNDNEKLVVILAKNILSSSSEPSQDIYNPFENCFPTTVGEPFRAIPHKEYAYLIMDPMGRRSTSCSDAEPNSLLRIYLDSVNERGASVRISNSPRAETYKEIFMTEGETIRTYHPDYNLKFLTNNEFTAIFVVVPINQQTQDIAPISVDSSDYGWFLRNLKFILDTKNVPYKIISSKDLPSRDLNNLFPIRAVSSTINPGTSSQAERVNIVPEFKIFLSETGSPEDNVVAVDVMYHLQNILNYPPNTNWGVLFNDVDFSKIDSQINLAIKNGEAVIIVGSNLKVSYADPAPVPVISDPFRGCTVVLSGPAYRTQHGTETTFFVLPVESRRPASCMDASVLSVAKLNFERFHESDVMVLVSVNNGDVSNHIIKKGESARITRNYELKILDIRYPVVVFSVELYVPNPFTEQESEYDYVCAPGCKEVPEGCLCPKTRILRGVSGYVVDTQGLNLESDKIKFVPGSNLIIIYDDEGKSMEIESREMTNEGLEIEISNNGVRRKITLVSDEQKIMTRIIQNGVEARTRSSVFASDNGLEVETDSGSRIVKVLPSVASDRAKEVLSEKFGELELKFVGSNLVYESNEEQRFRILGFISSKSDVSVVIDAETGEMDVSKPWFSFMSSRDK